MTVNKPCVTFDNITQISNSREINMNSIQDRLKIIDASIHYNATGNDKNRSNKWSAMFPYLGLFNKHSTCGFEII